MVVVVVAIGVTLLENASQLALVEPNLDARRLKGRADALCHIGILRGLAEESRPLLLS
jgi:hypothetical protein